MEKKNRTDKQIFFQTKHRLNGLSSKEKCVTSGNTFSNQTVQLEPSQYIYRNEYKFGKITDRKITMAIHFGDLKTYTQTTHMHKIPICSSITRSHFNSKREWVRFVSLSLSRPVYFASLEIMMFDHYIACTFSSSTHTQTHQKNETPLNQIRLD